MTIKVTKDKVSIKEKILNHYGEYNVNKCIFEFDEYFTDVLVKRAVFSSKKTNKTIEIDIINNKCVVPADILVETYDQVTLGVYGYDISGDELLIRYSPEPTYFVVHEGSYRENAEQPEIITPSQYDMYSQALQEGLAEVDGRLDDVEKQGDYAKEQGDYAQEQGDYAKEQGTNAKNVADDTQKKAEEGKFNGKSLEFVWQGTKLGVRLEGQEEYQFVDLQGVQGEIGATGEPFKIKKTYASVSEMNADFRNMEFGDYVMIASSVDVEDNAKLYTRGESAWIFISDFSGAMGIRGETGLTPNIKIGEVKTLEAGSQAKVTRSGSNEEPVFNFELPKGDKGDDYVLTEEDKVEIGEKVNTEYEKRIAENEKDIIDIESYLDNLTPKNSASGELVHVTDALGLPTFENTISGNVEQETTKGYNILNLKDVSNTQRDVLLNVKNNKISTSGTANTTGYVSFQLEDNVNLVTGDNIILHCDKPITLVLLDSGYQSLGIKWNNENSKKISFTEEKEIVYIAISVTEGTSYNYDDIKIMIERGTEAHEIEPYTGGQASPNPEFPQEIEVLEGYNLIDIQNNNWVYRNSSVDNANKAHQNYGNGIVIDYDYRNTEEYRFAFIKYPFKANKYYCLNAIVTKLGTLDAMVQLYLPDTEQHLTIGKPFKPNKDCNWIGIYFQSLKEGLKYAFTDVILQEVDSLTANLKPYLPYGCVGVKVTGENLFNVLGEIVNGINIDNMVFSNGGIKATLVDSYGGSYIKYGEVYKPGKYTFTTKLTHNNNNISDSVRLGFDKPVKVQSSALTYNSYYNCYFMDVSSTKAEITATEPFSITMAINAWRGAQKDDVVEFTEIMLSKEGGEYEPYKEQIAYLDLKGNFVGKINDNIKDYLVTDKKKYWLVKNVRKYVVTGNEEFNMYTLNGITIFRFSFNEIKSFNQRILCCNYFTFQDNGINKTNCISNRYGNFYNVEFSINGYSTIDEFKAFLKEKYNSSSPIEFLYRTKETEIIELGELPEPIKTFEGTNNIQVLANLDTEIEVKYALDLKKYTDNKLAEISAQII